MAPLNIVATTAFYRWSFVVLLCLAFARIDGSQASSQQCERLKAAFTYTQEDAPRDVSVVLPIVVERVNRELDGVVDVEVEWTGGDLHGQVGEHFITCKVTRLATALDQDGSSSTDKENAAVEIYADGEGRDVTTQCFHVPFSITDTNECLLPNDHPMRHRCHESAVCINTSGSYECLCPGDDESIVDVAMADDDFWSTIASQDRGPWERSFDAASRTSCPGMPSTKECCLDRVHSTKGDAASSCRAKFRCPRDPCNSNNDRNTCSENALCVRAATPTAYPDYECRCPDGLMGNGHQCKPGDATPDPKVKFDGKTPTELTVRNNLYCDCTLPIVDACDGFPTCQGKHQICTVFAGNQPRCACKPGYVEHESYGCVDESPPVLLLKNDPNGDHILRLKQGDVYKEYSVDIQDENAEEHLRSLKMTYSHPLPPGCFKKIGEFHVNYTVATPWTSPPYVRITRRVIVEDIDECQLDARQYENTCPDLVPRCDTENGAVCVNTNGGYTCKCPRLTSGDGFQKGMSFGSLNTPEGFQGGTGCRDTGKPVIELRGPNPKIFRVAECSGIRGEAGDKGDRDASLKAAQQAAYESDIKGLIRASGGAELCATHMTGTTQASDCVKAYDETYKDRIDISTSVTVGDPVKKSGLLWSVPYNVKDAAGNAARTVWRDVVVEEVDLMELEKKIRKEVSQRYEMEVKREVQAALEEDRRARRNAETKQPVCPPCNCSDKLDRAMCDAMCEERIKHCAIEHESNVIWFFLQLERAIPNSGVFAMGSLAVMLGFMILRLILGEIFRQPNRQPYIDEEKQRNLMQSVTNLGEGASSSSASRHTTPNHQHNPQHAFGSPPPRASLSTGQENGFFSPPGNGMNGYSNNSVPVFQPNDISSNGAAAASSFLSNPTFTTTAAAAAGVPEDYSDIYMASPKSIITPRRQGGGGGAGNGGDGWGGASPFGSGGGSRFGSR